MVGDGLERSVGQIASERNKKTLVDEFKCVGVLHDVIPEVVCLWLDCLSIVSCHGGGSVRAVADSALDRRLPL